MLSHSYPLSKHAGQLRRSLVVWCAPLLVALLIAGCGGTAANKTPSATTTPVPIPVLVYQSMSTVGGPNNLSGAVTAINAQTHTTLWQAQQQLGIGLGTLAEEKGTVYAFTQSRSVAAYSAKTGNIVWQASIPSQNPLILSDMLEAQDGVVIVVVSTVNQTDASASMSTITALDAGSGAVLWSKTITGAAIWNAPQMSDGTLCLAKIVEPSSPTGQVTSTPVALDIHTGAMLWQGKAHPGYVNSTLESAGTFYAIFSANPYTLIAYHEADGAVLWQKSAAYEELATATANSAYVFLSGSASTELAAFDPTTGKEQWHQPVGTWVWGQEHVEPAPVASMDANALYVSTTGKYPYTYSGQPSSSAPVQSEVEAHSLTDGSLLWKAALTGLLSPPVVSNGLVYVASGDFDSQTSLPISQGHYTLSALHASDGTVAWTLPISGLVQYPPLLIQSS